MFKSISNSCPSYT